MHHGKRNKNNENELYALSRVTTEGEQSSVCPQPGHHRYPLSGVSMAMQKCKEVTGISMAVFKLGLTRTYKQLTDPGSSGWPLVPKLPRTKGTLSKG